MGGALQWHFTFMWIFVGTGLIYVVYQIVSGRYKQVLFTPKDIRGVWPMARSTAVGTPMPVMPQPPIRPCAFKRAKAGAAAST